jgi:hypothetical protein
MERSPGRDLRTDHAGIGGGASAATEKKESMRLSLKQASAQFGPSVSSLRIRIEAGLLPSFRLHPKGKIWVKSEDVEALMIQMNRPAPADEDAKIESMKAFIDQFRTSLGIHVRKRRITYQEEDR